MLVSHPRHVKKLFGSLNIVEFVTGKESMTTNKVSEDEFYYF